MRIDNLNVGRRCQNTAQHWRSTPIDRTFLHSFAGHGCSVFPPFAPRTRNACSPGAAGIHSLYRRATSQSDGTSPSVSAGVLQEGTAPGKVTPLGKILELYTIFPTGAGRRTPCGPGLGTSFTWKTPLPIRGWMCSTSQLASTGLRWGVAEIPVMYYHPLSSQLSLDTLSQLNTFVSHGPPLSLKRAPTCNIGTVGIVTIGQTDQF